MRTCETRVVVLLVTLSFACASTGGRTPAAPPLRLKIVLNKAEFFEGEPIHALFELRNVSSGTVRIPPFELSTPWLVGVLHPANGSVVPVGRIMYGDYMCRETCNDDPV